MSPQPSKSSSARRNEELKFAYAGPFAPLLNPIRPVKPVRSPRGLVVKPQPRYSEDSPESYTIGSRLPARVVAALEATFGRGAGERVLDDVPSQNPALRTHDGHDVGDPNWESRKPKRRRRRGSRGGRKPVAS